MQQQRRRQQQQQQQLLSIIFTSSSANDRQQHAAACIVSRQLRRHAAAAQLVCRVFAGSNAQPGHTQRQPSTGAAAALDEAGSVPCPAGSRAASVPAVPCTYNKQQLQDCAGVYSRAAQAPRTCKGSSGSAVQPAVAPLQPHLPHGQPSQRYSQPRIPGCGLCHR